MNRALSEFYRGIRKFIRVATWVRLHIGYRVYGIESVNRALLTHSEPAWMLRAFGGVISKKVAIHPYLMIHEASDSYANLTVHDNVSISRNVFLDLSGPIIIHENCSIGMRAMIFTHTDFRRSSEISRLYPRLVAPVTICHDTVIGAQAVILPGITVNPFCIVAAGAVVASDVPAGSLVAGNPARIVRRLEIGSSAVKGEIAAP